MIPKAFNNINQEDLADLIANPVPEGRTIEYKRSLPGSSDGEKKEFLADVSSFANTSGGDLIFGIAEDRGMPTQIVGIQSADLDLEVRRLDSILSAGLSPRVRSSMKSITTNTAQRVLIIRVERSWSSPHRVVFQGHDKFYGRNAAGKYPLDVDELRAAFTLSSTVIERIRAFRVDRIISLSNNETPVPFTDAPKVVLHCIPLESFASHQDYDILPFNENPELLQPMGTARWDRRLNLEGILAFGIHKPCHTYTQLYRTGIIEVVRGDLLAEERGGQMMIPHIAFEKEVFNYLPRCFRILAQLDCGAPVVIALTLLKTRGLVMGFKGILRVDCSDPISSENIILPETVVEDLSKRPGKILKPMFDRIWNACGLPASTNVDSEGNWVTQS